MAKKDFLGELAKHVENEKRTGTKITRDSMTSMTPASDKKEVVETPPLPIKEEEDLFLKDEEPIVEEVKPLPKKEEPPKKVVKEPVFQPVEEPQEEQPASFNEETFKPVANPKKKLSKTGIAILAVLLLGILFAIYWFFIAAHIVVPNFVGKKMGDVSNWAKQNKIEKSAIAVGEPEFNFDVAKDIIISQSVAEGSKVKEDTPITFVVSKGPDPDEQIAFPELKEMSVEEIEAWKKENKLLKTNIKSVYNDVIEKGKVITFKIKDGSESDFKRGSVLNIEVSKGVQPEGQVNVIDFVGKSYTTAEEWAKKQKVEIDKIEAFSEDKSVGTIIKQSIKAGANMSNGDRLVLTVSKGKGVLIPDFTGYNAKRLEVWSKKKNNASITLVIDEVFSAKPEGTVVGQDVRAGALVDQDEAILITVSKFLPVVCNESTQQFNGQNVLVLRNHINDMNKHGARIIVGEFDKSREYSNDIPKDGIIEIKCRNNPKDPWMPCYNPIAIDGQVSYQLSKGKRRQNIALTQDDIKDLASIQNFCASNNMACNFSESPYGLLNSKVAVTVKGRTYYGAQHFQVSLDQEDPIEVQYDSTIDSQEGQVVMTQDDLKDLNSINNFCSGNGMNCTFVPSDKVSNIEVTVGFFGNTHKTDDSFQVVLNKGQYLLVEYKQNVTVTLPDQDDNPFVVIENANTLSEIQQRMKENKIKVNFIGGFSKELKESAPDWEKNMHSKFNDGAIYVIKVENELYTNKEPIILDSTSLRSGVEIYFDSRSKEDKAKNSASNEAAQDGNKNAQDLSTNKESGADEKNQAESTPSPDPATAPQN